MPLNVNSTIILKWSDASTDEQGFEIEQLNESGVYVPLAITDQNATEHTVADVDLTRTNQWRIRSFNQAGHSAWVYSGVLSPIAPPDPPIGEVIQPLEDCVTALNGVLNVLKG